MGVGESLSSYTPVVFEIPLLAEVSVVMVLGSSMLVSTTTTGPGVYSSRISTGKPVANSGWLPWYGSSRPSRSYAVYQSNFSLVRFLNSKCATYSVFLDFYPHLFNVFMTCCSIGYSVYLLCLRMSPVFKQKNV